MAGPIPIHDGYSVEPLTRELFGELAPLMFDAFGDSVTADYFQWKYLDNPAGEAIGCIARSDRDGAIAAFYGMIPEIYRFGGTQRRTYQSCDTMTHSSHRRKGLFRSLALMTYRDALAVDADFLAYGFGGPTSTPGFLKMDWRIEFEIPHLFRPYPLTLWSARGSRQPKVEELEQLDGALVAMVCQGADGRANSIDLSEGFVSWRLANPQRSYLYVRDSDSYAIYYRSGDFLFLFDFWEAERGAGREVLSALQRYSLQPRTKGILTFCQEGTPLENRLRRHGLIRNPFRRGPASTRLPFITFNAGKLRPRDWSVTPFDHDSY